MRRAAETAGKLASLALLLGALVLLAVAQVVELLGRERR